MAKRMLLISLFPASVAILASSSAAFALLCSAPQPRRTCTSSCVLLYVHRHSWYGRGILSSDRCCCVKHVTYWSCSLKILLPIPTLSLASRFHRMR